MKSPRFRFIAFPFLLATLFSLSWPISSAHDNFLDCLSLNDCDSSIFEVIYTQNSSSYSSVLNYTLHNARFSTPSLNPLIIVTPSDPSHIQATIYCARQHGLQIRTRSGGHDLEGLSFASQLPFVMIDMINFRSVDIDEDNKVAWVQAGAILGELYYKIAEKSKTLAFPAGICHSVGLGGYLSGGGYGLLFRKYGLAVDNVIDAQFIDVNGRILDRKSMGEDLFWAIRGGGGGSFGIVLAWKLRLVQIPETVTIFSVARTKEQNAIELLHRWQYVAHKFPNEAFFLVLLSSVNSGQDGKRTVVASFNLVFFGGVDELVPLMEERFPELGIVKEDCFETTWIHSMLFANQIPHKPLEVLLDRTYKTPVSSDASLKAKSDFVKEPIPETALQGLWDKLYEEEATTGRVLFAAYGGIMDDIPETATPFPHRAGNLYKILYTIGWGEDDNDKADKYIGWIRRVYEYMGSFVSSSPRGAYINYRDLDIGTNNVQGDTSYEQASVWGHKYFKDNFERLARVKAMVDPENFFRHEQSIPPVLLSTDD